VAFTRQGDTQVDTHPGHKSAGLVGADERLSDGIEKKVEAMSTKLLDLESDAFLEQMDNKNKSVNV
jgi:hypothetical protein